MKCPIAGKSNCQVCLAEEKTKVAPPVLYRLAPEGDPHHCSLCHQRWQAAR